MRVVSLLRIFASVFIASSLLAAPANLQVDTKTHVVTATDGSAIMDAKDVTLTVGGFTIYDGVGVKTVVTGSTSGAMFGASGNKIGFLGATPIVRPAGTIDLRLALINLGLYATGGATPLNLNGGAFTASTISGTSETLSGTLGVTGNATFGGTVGITGATTGSSLTLTGNGLVGGTFGVTGASTFHSIAGTNETLSGTFGLTGNATFGGTVAITGATTGSSLDLTGDETIGGALSVTGATVGSSFSFTGNGAVGGTFGVTGTTTLNGLSATTATVGVISPMTGTIFNLAGPSYWSATNSVQPNPLVSFAGPGNDAGSVNAYFMTARWDAGASQKGYTLSVENIVPSNAPSFGAGAAIYGGLLNYRGGTDCAGIIGVIDNATSITPTGTALWGIVRGPNAGGGSVDGIRSFSETDGSQNPLNGVVVANSTANNAFHTAFLVSGAVDYGFRVGVGTNLPGEVTPAYPFIFIRKTDGQTRFSVDETGKVAGSKLSVADSDIWSVPWTLASRAAGNDVAGTARTAGPLKISYGSEEVVDIIPQALGGPSIALLGNDSGLELGFGSKIYRDSADGSTHLFSQSGTTKITGALSTTGGISAASLSATGNISGASVTATGPVSGSNTCKAWVNFSDNGTITVNKSFNVTSVTRNGAGDYTINFTNAMADANYAATISGKLTGGVPFLGMEQMDSAIRSTSALRIFTLNGSFTATNAVGCSVVVFD